MKKSSLRIKTFQGRTVFQDSQSSRHWIVIREAESPRFLICRLLENGILQQTAVIDAADLQIVFEQETDK